MAVFMMIYPGNWNEIKFRLKGTMTALYIEEPPDFVLGFLDAIGCKSACLEDYGYEAVKDRILPGSVLWRPRSAEDGQIMMEPDLEAMAEPWDSVKDEREIYIECAPYNFVGTVLSFQGFLKRRRTKALASLGYTFRLLAWESDIALLSDGQRRFYGRTARESITTADIGGRDRYSVITLDAPADDIASLDGDIATVKKCVLVTEARHMPEVYRRHAVRKALRKRLGGDLYENDFLRRFETCIVSNPASMTVLPEAEHYLYDRSDLWRAQPGGDSEAEDEILMRAERITCSSIYLYNDTIEWLRRNRPGENVRVSYVPNGNALFEYKDTGKFSRPTAVYAGRNLRKVDIPTIAYLAEKNPGWDFLIYCIHRERLEGMPGNVQLLDNVPLEALFAVLCKSHLGLITLRKCEWTRGMLSDKLFNYINARIPTLLSGVEMENYKEYREVAFEAPDDFILDPFLEMRIPASTYRKYERSWETVAREVLDELYG